MAEAQDEWCPTCNGTGKVTRNKRRDLEDLQDHSAVLEHKVGQAHEHLYKILKSKRVQSLDDARAHAHEAKEWLMGYGRPRS